MHKFKEYMIARYPIYIITLLIILFYYLVFYLYDALFDAFSYATVLSIALVVLYFMIDFYHYVKKSNQLDHILHVPDASLMELPQAINSIEKKYQSLVNMINTLYKDQINDHENQYHDQIDYFTLWVHQMKIPISALRLLIQSGEYSSKDLLVQILRIEQYVDMALYYIKMDDMSGDLRIKTCRLSDIVNEVLKKYAVFFMQKKIRLELDDIDLMILSDEKWIAFVIEQLLSNALKYTKTGSIHIYVKDETLYIQDSGIGIKEEDLPRLFEKGFTGYNGRLDKKASGLGLYLSYHILKNLGLSLAIESTLHQGTTAMINFHIDDLQVD